MPAQSTDAPYLRAVRVVEERVPSYDDYPFALPLVQGLDITFDTPVTFFVGENGCGKSTVLEAIASLLDFPASGGGPEDLADMAHSPESLAPLATALRPSFAERPHGGFFFRAELLAHFAEVLEERERDPDFIGAPYARYGGRTLHTRSHGEAFLEVFRGRLGGGMFLMDEPEAALSPQRQLTLLTMIADKVAGERTQVIIATHSPILMTYPEATLLSFDDGSIQRIALEDTTHYQITRGILDAPERYWKHLRDAGQPRDDEG